MSEIMAGINFRAMTWMFNVRDLLRPRIDILGKVDFEKGETVLDYGCGPGGYTFPAADLVGPEGKVYAQDIQPLAVDRIRDLAKKRGYDNICTRLSDRDTGLEDGSVDKVLLFDVYHDLADPEGVLGEIHRVLREGGKLLFSDHHLRDGDIRKELTGGNAFLLERSDGGLYVFGKKTTGSTP